MSARHKKARRHRPASIHTYVATQSVLFLSAVRRALQSAPFRVSAVAGIDDFDFSKCSASSVFVLDRDFLPASSKRGLAALNLKAACNPKLLVGDVSAVEMCEFITQGVDGFCRLKLWSGSFRTHWMH